MTKKDYLDAVNCWNEENPMHHRLVLEFSPGDYEHSVKCYFAAKQWALDSGQCFNPKLDAIIHSPSHPDCPAESRIVPQELINRPGWTLRVEIACVDQETLDWLLGLDLPEGAHWKRFEI